MGRELRLEPVTTEAFAPFGEVLGGDRGGDPRGRTANQGTATRSDFVLRPENLRGPEAPLNVALFRSVGRALPVSVGLLERHPSSSQAFVPLGTGRLAIVVAPNGPDDRPSLAGARAFLVEPGQGVSYRPGTWHAPLIAVEFDAEALMLAYEAGTAEDVDECLLTDGLLVLDTNP